MPTLIKHITEAEAEESAQAKAHARLRQMPSIKAVISVQFLDWLESKGKLGTWTKLETLLNDYKALRALQGYKYDTYRTKSDAELKSAQEKVLVRLKRIEQEMNRRG